jgi:hypothetical protein
VTESYCNDGRCERVRNGERHLVHDLTKLEAQRSESLHTMLNLGSELTGGSVGAAAGMFLAGPEGAVVGSIVGTTIGFTLKQMGDEVTRRFLSPREKKRTGAVIIHAANRIQSNRQNGHALREDGFFTSTTTERSPAEEIAEGVILAAQKEYEEKKLPYFGNLLANIAFSSGVSRAHGDELIKIARNISYRQLCFLSIVGQKDKFNLRQPAYQANSPLPIGLVALLHEIFEMEKDALISSGTVITGLADLNPGLLNLEGQGENLFKLMNLSEIPLEDLIPLTEILNKS